MSNIAFGNYEEFKDSLRVRLVDIRSNAEALRDCIYEPVGCGFALVACFELPEEITERGVASVPRAVAEMPGIDKRRVMLDAMLGSCAMDYPKLCPIYNMLFEDGTKNLLTEGKYRNDGTLLVLTTEDGFLGASALFYPDMMKRIGQLIGSDYYVLPSSIHEVLIMPDDGKMTPGELAMMVKTVNEHEVSRSEQLGNRVLHFRNDLQKLQVAADLDQNTEKDKERGQWR